MIELTPTDEFRLEEAWKSMSLARKLYNQKRRARAQEVLREAIELLSHMPRGFTSTEIDLELDQLHKLLY